MLDNEWTSLRWFPVKNIINIDKLERGLVKWKIKAPIKI